MKNEQTNTEKLTSGLRNNNLGNIRLGNTVWLGEIRPGQDNEFCHFRSMAYGYRALLKLLRSYSRLYGCDTIRSIITRWAPPVENHTEAYISHVCREMGNAYDEMYVIDRDSKEVMCKLAAAISLMENGVTPKMEEIEKGWELLN